ncbi:MAG: hypothetical protein HY081_08640, partial [Gammaproteobacteria bacterium]|nr:hypothetical protein [Gammaproteobacteria bacterium]
MTKASRVSPSASIPKEQALMRLLQLASPVLPVGAYSYSEGLEYVVHAGSINDAPSLRAWIEDGMEFGRDYLR